MRQLLRLSVLGLWLVAAPAFAETVKLSIIEVNDFYQMSEEDGRGGFARLAAVVKAERAKGGAVLVLHAGDTLSPSLMSGLDHGEHMVALFNALGLDALAPGNHEFDFGKDNYLRLMASAKFALLAANLRDASGQPLPGHKDGEILAFGGVKLGILGAALDATPTLSSSGDLAFSSTYDGVAREAKALRDQGADVVIAIAHSTMENDWRMFDAHLADLFVLGHVHDLRLEYDGRSAMMESGENDQFIEIVDLTIDKTVKDGKAKVSWRPNFRIIDSAAVTPDPDMAALVKPYEDELGKEMNVALATLDAPFDTHEQASRTRETPFGDLIADAMRDATGADVALTNGGGIRGDKDYAAGANFTRKDVLTELPFGNRTVVVKLSGADLLAALEHGLSGLPKPLGGFPQVSGMTVTVDASKPVGSRVARVTIGAGPLDVTANYSLATNDYLMRGGDGYDMLAKAEVVKGPEAGSLLANDVMVRVRKLGALALSLAPDGRIAIRP